MIPTVTFCLRQRYWWSQRSLWLPLMSFRPPLSNCLGSDLQYLTRSQWRVFQYILYIIFCKSLIFCCWKYLTCSRCNSKPIVKRVNAQNSKVSISTSVEEELESKLNSLQRGIFHSFEAFESKNLKKDFKSSQWIFSHPEVDSFKTDPPSPFFA